MKKLKILYAGSPEPSKTTLEILYENQEKYNYEIVGVLTNPPTAKGRHKELVPTPVGMFAREKQLKVFEPEHLDTQCREEIKPYGADLLVCFAYGHIFGPKFLSLFPFGGINLHPSELPKYRGCTPVQATILNGDDFAFVSIQTVALKMDEGNILKTDFMQLQKEENPDENADSILNWAAKAGAEKILELLGEVSEAEKMPEGTVQGPCSEEPTKIITKEMAKINWQTENTLTIERKIRAYYSNPCCWCLENGQPLKIISANAFTSVPGTENFEQAIMNSEAYKAAVPGKVLVKSLNPKKPFIYVKTTDGLLKILKLQRQGKNAMTDREFLNGARTFDGAVLE